MSRRYILFLMASGCAAMINVVSRIFFSLIMSYESAIVVAHLTGMTVAFTLNRQFVFNRRNGAIAAQYAKFAMVNGVSLTQTWLVSILFAHYVFPALVFTWRPETIAHMIGVASLMATSYYGHKKHSFA